MSKPSVKSAVAGWQSTFDAWGERILSRWTELGSIWSVAQIAVIFGAYLAATFLTGRIVPALEARLRQIKQQPRLLRFLAIVLRRTKWIVFSGILITAAAVLLQVTWPSNSYFVRTAASLSTAWVLISVVSRIIRNKTLANLIAALAWVVVALYLGDLLDSVLVAMDGAAITVGAFKISALTVFKWVLLFGTLLWLALFTSEVIDQRLTGSLDIDPSIAVLIRKVVRAGLLTLVLVISFSAAGIDLTAFAVFSGALGLGIGFGLQKVASNLISGFIILLDRSIKPGDVISLGTTFGWITALKGRYVQVNTRDGIEYLIPNETFITERLANMSHTDRAIRLEVRFGVSYASDPHLVRKIANDVAMALPRVISEPPPVCHVVGFGESSIDFVLRFWIQDPELGVTNIRGEAFLGLWDAFKKHGIEIPYPHREVLLRSTDSIDQSIALLRDSRQRMAGT